jgi:hypothetical protein
MLSIGGLPFTIEPRQRLNEAERHVLEPWERAAAASLPVPAMCIEIVPDPWLDGGFTRLPPPFEHAAVVDWIDGAVRVSHERFHARIDPFAARGRLWRGESGSAGLRATLRAALSSRLPIAGGLPLHAAGVVLGDEAFVFFGPSGAGKSTLASFAPGPVLSDELIAVTPARPFAVAATSVWGTLGVRDAPKEAFPLRALVELARGPGMSLSRLEPSVALRRLIAVTLVPVGPPLWARALHTLGELVQAVPVWRMSWAPGALDWARLAADL